MNNVSLAPYKSIKNFGLLMYNNLSLIQKKKECYNFKRNMIDVV